MSLVDLLKESSSSHEQEIDERGGERKLTTSSHGLDIVNNSHRLGFWVLPRVIGVEAVDVGHQEKVVGVYLERKRAKRARSSQLRARLIEERSALERDRPTMLEAMAESVSLSPNLISW